MRLSQPSPTPAFAAHWSAPGACHALSRERRLQLLCLTAASGDVANLEVALAAAGLCPTGQLMAAAATAGQLRVCRWLAERGCPLEASNKEHSPLLAASKGGHAEICEWLLEQGCTWTPECVYSAAAGGHVELMRSLLRKAPPGPTGHVLEARQVASGVQGCDLQTVQQLWSERVIEENEWLVWKLCRGFAAATAARSPTPDWAAKVAWFLEESTAGGDGWITWAAASCPDALARLTLLVEGMGLPVNALAADAAMDNGRADAVRWLLARGVRPTSSQGLRMAAERGHTEVLRALHAAGCELLPPEELVAAACASGSVETVSWAVEACGAEALQAVGPEAFSASLFAGSLELVTWLRARGVEPAPDALLFAAEGGCAAALELLPEWGVDVQQGPECPPEDLYLAAAKAGDLLTLEALRRLGVPLGLSQQEVRVVVGKAIRDEAPLPALRWLAQAAGEVDWAAAEEAVNCAGNLVGWVAEARAWVQAEAQQVQGPLPAGRE